MSQNITIITASLAALSEHENYERINELRNDLLDAGISFVGVSELHLGKPRQAFLVLSKPSKTLLKLAKKFRQESICYINGKKETSIIPVNEKKPKVAKPLPVLKTVDEKTALAQKYSLRVQEDGQTRFFAPIE